MAVFAIALPASAQARARDDVMSNAFRCAGIADTRQWLDCYYGAAQPVRAELGLAPAPAGQMHLAAAPPAGGTVADTAARDDVMSNAFRCNALADDRQWLDCYYGATGPVRAALGLSPLSQARSASGGGAVASLAAPPAKSGGFLPGVFGGADRPVPEGQFGEASSQTNPTMSVTRIVSRMTSYKFDNYEGMFTVTLANGQTWRQLSGDTSNAHWNKPAATYQVIITHGAFGSFNFRVQGLPGLYKVHRIS